MIRLTIVATCILFKIFLPNFAFASNLNPEKILDSVDDLYRSNTSYGILTLSVTTKNWQRTLTLEQWSKGEDRHLIKVLKPKKEKGRSSTTHRTFKNSRHYTKVHQKV